MITVQPANADMRMIASVAHPHDAAAARAFVERDVARTRNFAMATNHWMLTGGDVWKGRLAGLRAPTLVVHGAGDLPVRTRPDDRRNRERIAPGEA